MHTLNGGVSLEGAATAHAADLAIQGGHAARFLRYWVAEREGKVLCLVEAPSGEAAASVHRQPHGQGADERYQGRGAGSRHGHAARWGCRAHPAAPSTTDAFVPPATSIHEEIQQ